MNEEQHIERIEALLRKGSFAQLSAEDKAFMLEQGIDEQAFRFLAQGIGPDPEPVPALPEAMRAAVLSHFDAHAPQSTSSNGSSSSAAGKTGGSALRMQIFKYSAIAAVSVGAVLSVFFLLNSNKQSMHEDVAVVQKHDSMHTSEAAKTAPMVPPSPADTLRSANAAELSVAGSYADDAYAVPEVSYGYGASAPAPATEELPFEQEQAVRDEIVKEAEKKTGSDLNTDLNGYYKTSASNTIVQANKLQRRDKEGKWSSKGTKNEAYDNDKEEDAKVKKENQQLDEIVVSQSKGPGRTAMPQYPSIEEVANTRYQGGYPAFDKFLADNLKLPAYRSNYTQIENTVVMEIDINKNGIISRRALVSSPDTQLTREVNLVLDKIPPFTKGRNVTVQIPFRFR
ncbi:MAG: energy transducer TonB [Bacteroidia bacterium]|nr:energy transducer TonB [Bacteroidia bacterium]